MKRSLSFRLLYALGMAAVFALIGWQAVMKGWFSFTVLPPLLLIIPLTIAAHVKMHKQIGVGTVYSKTLPTALAQLVSLAVFYVCLPGIGDNETVYMFGFKEMQSGDMIVQICTWFTLTALIGWVITSVLLRRYLRRGRVPIKAQV